MNNHFIKDFIFDEEQKQTLTSLLKELEPKMTRATVYHEDPKKQISESRVCDNIPLNYKRFPDISMELRNFLFDMQTDFPEDVWFAQFEMIRYQGVGQQFLRHRDDNKNHSDYNRLYTSVTMIEKSEDLVGCKLKIWTPEEKEYVIDLEPFETVIFPAYYEHEATPLLQGRRVVLISWAQREGRVLTSQ